MKFEMTAEMREQAGKGVARQLRRRGKIPAVLYGQEECLLLTLDPDGVRKILRSHAAGTALVSLTLTGAKSKAIERRCCETTKSTRSAGSYCMPTCLKSLWTKQFGLRCRSL